ncbi:MAG: DUF58 domain-containing protein [Spirochaetes bacterium]|nr:DUF58 domain-containing protein [Spirochaetota bacterium]
MSKSHDNAGLRSVIKKVREIEIRSRKTAEDLLSGEYRTVFKGMGMEFEEVREYIRGDDIRFVDWNVSARTGKLFIKKFREERELTVLIVIDISGSSFFGSNVQVKKDLAIELAAVLSLSAIKSKDKVGLLLFSDRIEKYIPAKKGQKHVLRIIRELLTTEPAGRKTDINIAMKFLSKIFKKRAIVFLLSDFFTEGFEKNLQTFSRKHDLVPIILRDRMEHVIEDIGLVSFEDAESGQIHHIDTSSAKARNAFSSYIKEQDMKLKNTFISNKIDSITIKTGSSYLEPLMLFFRKRAGRY